MFAKDKVSKLLLGMRTAYLIAWVGLLGWVVGTALFVVDIPRITFVAQV